MKTVARVRVASVAKIAPIVSGLVGATIGAAAILSMLLEGSVSSSDLFVVLLFPVIWAVSGLLLGAVGAWLYNVVAGWVGGIELEIRG